MLATNLVDVSQVLASLKVVVSHTRHAVLAIYLCLSVCLSVSLSVTSRCSVKIAQHIDLDFYTEANLHFTGIRVSSE